MKRHCTWLSLFLTVLVISCTPIRVPLENWETKLPRAVQLDIKTWKSDRLDCRGTRKEDAALRILEAFKTRGSTNKAQIEFSLGRSEFQQTRNGMKVLGYYFDTKCTGNEIVEGSVYCVLEFYLNGSGLLTDGMVVCG